MRRTLASTVCGNLVIAGALAVVLLGGCTRSDSGKSQKPLPTIAPIEGMKYYVGGPVMKYDKYNRLRLGGFSGEVAAPTSRGLLIGYKLDGDGKHFEYRTWLNGRPVSRSTGFLDADSLLWFDERETFDSNGKVVARQTLTYDDANKVMRSVTNQLDPATNQVIGTNSQDMPYTPPEEPEEEEEEESPEGGPNGTQ